MVPPFKFIRIIRMSPRKISWLIFPQPCLAAIRRHLQGARLYQVERIGCIKGRTAPVCISLDCRPILSATPKNHIICNWYQQPPI